MPNVFDLSKVSDLVESQHPAWILVVDTNILMNDPDPTNWSVAAEGQNLFVLTPVTLVTGEWNLSNAVQMQGVPCHLCTSFPIEGLREAAAITKPVDWGQVLEEIQIDTRQKAIVVEATLTAQRSAPSWLVLVTGAKRFMIAEGRGVMRAGNSVRPFLWTIPFYPQPLDPRLSDDNEGLTDLPSVHLDFFGEDDSGQDLFDAIADRLVDCTSVSFWEGTPTLQGPESIMEMLLRFEYVAKYLDEQGISECIAQLRQELKESDGLTHYWTEWILDTEDEEEKYACLEGLVVALSNCWKIGETYTFSIIMGRMAHE